MNSLGGPDLLLYLVLAFGGAMFVGNLLALVRPPSKQPPAKKSTAKKSPGKPANASTKASPGSTSNPSNPSNPPKRVAAETGPKRPPQAAPLPVAPRGRTIAMMSVGGIAALWALATLLTK